MHGSSPCTQAPQAIRSQMRVREIHFSTSLRDIDLARWCMNNLSTFGEDRFYLRWNPETRDYAVPLYRAQDLRRLRKHAALRIVRLASRILTRPMPRAL
jgi:hypothetical protein